MRDSDDIAQLKEEIRKALLHIPDCDLQMTRSELINHDGAVKFGTMIAEVRQIQGATVTTAVIAEILTL